MLGPDVGSSALAWAGEWLRRRSSRKETIVAWLGVPSQLVAPVPASRARYLSVEGIHPYIDYRTILQLASLLSCCPNASNTGVVMTEETLTAPVRPLT